MSESEETKNEAENAEKTADDDGEESDEELPMVDVTDPRAADVLCGRGGAALRHEGIIAL